MNLRILKMMGVFLLLGASSAWADLPIWNGNGIYTFSDADPYFMEKGVYDSATLNITGGEFGALYCFDHSIVDMSNGKATSGISTYNYSILNLSGGSLGSLGATDYSQVHIFVLDHVVNTNSYLGYDQLTGHWGNENPFAMLISEVSWPNITIHVIPEPFTVSLLSLGVLFLKKRRI